MRRQPCTVDRTSSSPASSGNIGYAHAVNYAGKNDVNLWKTDLKLLRQDFPTIPPALLCHSEEIHVTIHQMGSMVRKEHKYGRQSFAEGTFQGKFTSV